MDKNDFEYLLTKKAWEDKEFADLLASNPYEALAQLGVSIPGNIKLKVVQQKKIFYISLFLPLIKSVVKKSLFNLIR